MKAKAFPTESDTGRSEMIEPFGENIISGNPKTLTRGRERRQTVKLIY